MFERIFPFEYRVMAAVTGLPVNPPLTVEWVPFGCSVPGQIVDSHHLDRVKFRVFPRTSFSVPSFERLAMPLRTDSVS